jgi:CDP-diacylglycerol--serine O-phosphatidyltransferase
MAPPILVFTLFSRFDDGWTPLGWIACLLWVACAAIRLARFNTTIDPTADKRFFIGLPSPGAAGVILASVWAFGIGLHDTARLWLLLVVAVPALLMVTNIRYRSFRSLVSPKSRRPYGLILVAVLLAAGFATVPAVTGCIAAYGYLFMPVVSPVLSMLARLVPRRIRDVLS